MSQTNKKPRQPRRFILHINRQSNTSIWTYFEAHDFSNLPQNIQDTMKDEYDFQQEISSGSRSRSGGGQPTGIWYKAVPNHSSSNVTTIVNCIEDNRLNPIGSRSSTNDDKDGKNRSSRGSSGSSRHSPTWEFAMTLQRTIGYSFINQTEREKCYKGESAMMELVIPSAK